MATLALCWELGGGAGHLAMLTEIASAAKRQGHRVCLIGRDLSLAGSMPEFDGVELFQAPTTPRQIFAEPVINYAGVLRSCGFQTAEILHTSLQAWMSLLKLLKADAVITEHAPTAVLATRLLSLPTVMTGNGFMTPPLVDPMPSMRPWEKISEAALRKADATVLPTINQVVTRDGIEHDPFPNLASVFSNAQQWIKCTPELDHYPRDKGIYARRNALLFQANEPVWPSVKGGSNKNDRVFVYFDAASLHLTNLMKQLVATGLPVLAVIPGASAELDNELKNTNISLTNERVNLQKVAQHCSVFINHGALTTALDLLIQGQPCILLPDTLERTLFAYRAGLAGLAFSGAFDPQKIDIQHMINVSRRAQNIRDNALEFKRRYADGGGLHDVDDLLQSLMQDVV